MQAISSSVKLNSQIVELNVHNLQLELYIVQIAFIILLHKDLLP